MIAEIYFIGNKVGAAVDQPDAHPAGVALRTVAWF